MRRVTAFLILACGLAALPLLLRAEPRAETRGPCSPAAMSGGSASATCTINMSEPGSKGRLVVQQAWLIPTIAFMALLGSDRRNEHVALSMVLRNLTDADVSISAGRLEILGPAAMSIQGDMVGVGVLGERIASTDPIRIEAGKSATVTFGSTIDLPGIIAGIESTVDVTGVMVFEEAIPVRSTNKGDVEAISALMARRYGRNTVIRASLYARDYHLLARFDLPVANGVDRHYQGEQDDKRSHRHVFRPLLAYDALLGCYLKQRERYVTGFKIRETPRRCIDAIPDADVPGGMRYRDSICPANVPPALQSSDPRHSPPASC